MLQTVVDDDNAPDSLEVSITHTKEAVIPGSQKKYTAYVVVATIKTSVRVVVGSKNKKVRIQRTNSVLGQLGFSPPRFPDFSMSQWHTPGVGLSAGGTDDENDGDEPEEDALGITPGLIPGRSEPIATTKAAASGSSSSSSRDGGGGDGGGGSGGGGGGGGGRGDVGNEVKERHGFRRLVVATEKRYSDFLRFNNEWRATHSDMDRTREDFQLPPRQWFWANFKPSVIEERRKAFEVYLWKMLQKKELRREVFQFLEIPVDLHDNLVPVDRRQQIDEEEASMTASSSISSLPGLMQPNSKHMPAGMRRDALRPIPPRRGSLKLDPRRKARKQKVAKHAQAAAAAALGARAGGGNSSSGRQGLRAALGSVQKPVVRRMSRTPASSMGSDGLPAGRTNRSKSSAHPLLQDSDDENEDKTQAAEAALKKKLQEKAKVKAAVDESPGAVQRRLNRYRPWSQYSMIRAIRHGNVEAVKLCLDAGLSPEARVGYMRKSPLDWAIYLRKLDIIDLFMEQGAIPSDERLAELAPPLATERGIADWNTSDPGERMDGTMKMIVDTVSPS